MALQRTVYRPRNAEHTVLHQVIAEFIGPKEEKVLVGDLLDALERDYGLNGRRSVNTLKHRLEPLRTAFGTWRAVDVSGEAVERYKSARLTEKTRGGNGTGTMSAATVNRELAALKRGFRLGLEQGRLAQVPVIKLMHEAAPREGFVEPGQFEEIARRLPDPIADIAKFAFTTGWRKNEVLSLVWSDVDLEHRRIRLRREHSKNGEPRVIVLTDDLLTLVQRRWAARHYQTKTGTALSTWVFHRQGRAVVDFRDQWGAACSAAKVPGLLFHDLRRSAVRNLDKSGVSQSVAMAITGHKTDSIYRRYRIVDEGDVEKALTATQQANRTAPVGGVIDMDAVSNTARA